MPTLQQDRSESRTSILDAIDVAENPIDATSIPPTESRKPARKKLIRRDDSDYSQQLRFAVQLFFATLNLWIGAQFYLWVRWAESGGQAFEVSRPAGVEGCLPIEGLMQLKYFLVSGHVPRVHGAGFFLFTSFLVISFVFRKSFCSWICPVGTVSEYLWKLGRSVANPLRRVTSCLECVAICPAKNALTVSIPSGARKRRAIPAWSMAAGIAILFLGMVGYAKVTGQWNTNLPKQVYLQLVPHANEQEHPMPGPQ